MNKKIKNLLDSEIVKYIFWGVATTVISTFAYISFVQVYKTTNTLTIIPTVVNGILTIISSIIGIIFAFYTNRKFVFKSNVVTRKEKIIEFISFLGARVTTLIIDLILVIIGSIYFPRNELIVKITSQIIVIITNYVLTKLIFSSKKSKPRSENGKIPFF